MPNRWHLIMLEKLTRRKIYSFSVRLLQALRSQQRFQVLGCIERTLAFCVNAHNQPADNPHFCRIIRFNAFSIFAIFRNGIASMLFDYLVFMLKMPALLFFAIDYPFGFRFTLNSIFNFDFAIFNFKRIILIALQLRRIWRLRDSKLQFPLFEIRRNPLREQFITEIYFSNESMLMEFGSHLR